MYHTVLLLISLLFSTPSSPPPVRVSPHAHSITFFLNGEKIELSAREANPRMTLLEVRPTPA